MDDFARIELPELYDLLAQQTNLYMKMLSNGATKEEFDQCRETMIAIQIEIKSRNNQIPVNKVSSADNPSLRLNSNGTAS